MLSFKDHLVENNVEIQFQDLAGTWKTINNTINQPIYIIKGMKDAKAKYNSRRVRAVDSKTGQLVDILP